MSSLIGLSLAIAAGALLYLASPHRHWLRTTPRTPFAVAGVLVGTVALAAWIAALGPIAGAVALAASLMPVWIALPCLGTLARPDPAARAHPARDRAAPDRSAPHIDAAAFRSER